MQAWFSGPCICMPEPKPNPASLDLYLPKQVDYKWSGVHNQTWAFRQSSQTRVNLQHKEKFLTFRNEANKWIVFNVLLFHPFTENSSFIRTWASTRHRLLVFWFRSNVANYKQTNKNKILLLNQFLVEQENLATSKVSAAARTSLSLSLSLSFSLFLSLSHSLSHTPTMLYG